MADDPSRTPPPGSPRVVKKVVKKTVVRPAGSARPSASGGEERARPRTTAVARAKAATAPKARRPAAPRPAAPRPKVVVGAKVGTAGKAIGTRGAGAARAGAGALRTAGSTVADTAIIRYGSLRDWRIPTIAPARAAVVTGVVTGLVVVLLGWLSTLMFFALRGTSAGGGTWGGLVLVAVTLVALALSTWLLRSFGVAQPGVISFLAVLLTLIVVLALFLESSATVWSLLILPGVGALSFLVAHRVVLMAEEHAGTPA